MIAMMALMTIMGILLLAAAPVVQRQQQRNLEEEAISRGEEVADAIRFYVRINNKLPNSMDDLLEGVTIPGRTKKLQILRASAAVDPLSTSGEWRLINVTAQEMADFVSNATEYNNNVAPLTTDSMFQRFIIQVMAKVRKMDEDDKEPAPGGEDTGGDSTGPFIGVASRSQRNSVITYYGIERHDKWVFTPLVR